MEQLIDSQNELFGRITRSFENLKKSGVARITMGVVEARLQNLEANWVKFEAQHAKLTADYKKELAKENYKTRDLYSETEEAYLTQKAMFLDTLHDLREPLDQETPTTPPPGTIPAPLPKRTTLPRIQLPQFSGRYEDWPPFRDLFNSLIGKDAATTPVEKLHYLKASVKGEAELLIKNLPTTSENFERAWRALTDFYENKRLLVRSYIAQFTALTKLKNESASELRKLFHCVMNTVSSLDGIARPITRGEDLFVHLVVELLDPRSRREWETAISETMDPPSYAELQMFLERRLHTLEALQPSKFEAAKSVDSAKPTRALHARKQDSKGGHCSLCGKEHYLLWCDVYQKKTAHERRRHVEANNLCVNCLGKHKVSECRSKKTCSSCHVQHHSSLHEAFSTAGNSTTSHLARSPPKLPAAVLLATARVCVTDRFGVTHTARALVDQGSESSLVSESLTQRLRLPRSSTSIAIYGVGGKQTGTARGLIALQIAPLTGGSPMTVPALVFPQLTLYDSGLKADPKSWKHLDGLELADPDYLAADPIDILLGADVYASILRPGLRRGEPGEPIAQQTELGWILSGPVRSTNFLRRALSLHCRAEEDLVALVQKFWQQDELSDCATPLTLAHQECEDQFRQTHTRACDGRYTVRLPVKAPLPDLSRTRHAAQRVLTSMERRFGQDVRLRQLYVEFLQQYEDMGHMTPLDGSEDSVRPVSYLPHHGVMRESSTTTKLRVVFNGSTTTSSGDSLNRHLLVGPNLLPSLADVLLRWRVHRFVLASDIEKMYRQILVHPDDRDLQRIIWRCHPREEFREFRLNTVTYGLACAPFLAMRVLRQLANDEEKLYPLGAAAIRRDVYMDDILTGADSLAEVRELRQQLTNLCMAGGFPLRKWSANEAGLLEDVPVEHRMNSELRDWQPHETHSTLGLRWHPSHDHFSFSTKNMAIAVVTKRSVLSLTARLFDPLGWLAPVVVNAKIAFQATWRQGTSWDEPLDKASTRRWIKYQAELHHLEEIRIPRWIGPVSPGNVEIHGFCDASELAYAAVAYLRIELSGSWRVSLLAARTKVAPLKQISLPRLELCAATLLARLVAHVRATLDLAGAPVHLWSDSTVALGWIKDHPTRWQTFVANRVSEIQTTVVDALWHHVPGNENPADCASRGLSPGEIADYQLWWRGPPWLKLNVSEWPAAAGASPETNLPEKRKRVHVIETKEKEELLMFSSLHRLVRVTAWCRRWLLCRRVGTDSLASASTRALEETLSVHELEAARLSWIRIEQAAHYSAEARSITLGQTLSKSSKILRLSPFLDSRGILRVGGRLAHAVLSYDERHPVILPDDSHLTRLIVDACHRRALHGGVQLTLSLVRQQYWIPRGRAVVKRVIRRCVTCVRWRAASPQQLMSDLPQERVTRARPFLHTGVDYAGPIQLRASKGRGQRAFKAFVAVFICLSTRAVHLEVVSDYSADAFLAALRRFISRRGICNTLFSDCGTTFVGADSQLRAMFSTGSPELKQIMARTASEGILWRFNPPSAPHFGGIWEAAVRSFKHHLRRVLGDHMLTFEEMSTLLAQVEACLNSRPLQALSDDPEDLSALTPGHFLVGSALTAIPEPSLQDRPINRLTRWQLLQQMRDHFWERWSREYLHSLLHRPKWHSKDTDIQVGQLCLVRGETIPPTRWPLARVIKLHPGKDGLVRVVTVRTATSELVRPIIKLVFLPVRDE